jgi:flagellar hook assembly protein FlgD
MMTSEAPAEVKAYPNPFRPKQGQRLIIDNISEDSFVSVYNRGGALVKSFYDSDVLGGRAEWDGTDKTGKLVAPGVYHYVVRKGSKKKTGKIILIH